MRQHKSEAGVQTGTAPRRRRDMADHEARGHEFEHILVSGALQLGAQCGPLGDARFRVANLAPSRNTKPSPYMIGTAIDLCGHEASLPVDAVVKLRNRIDAWFHPLLVPQEPSCFLTAFTRETMAQAQADVHQVAVWRAIETGNVVEIDRAVEATDEAIARQMELRSLMLTARASVVDAQRTVTRRFA